VVYEFRKNEFESSPSHLWSVHYLHSFFMCLTHYTEKQIKRYCDRSCHDIWLATFMMVVEFNIPLDTL